MSIKAENPAGTVRRGVDKWGLPSATAMKADYGFIDRTKASDGEGVDVFVGPNPLTPFVYVVHQIKPDTGDYDEDKVTLVVGSVARRVFNAE